MINIKYTSKGLLNSNAYIVTNEDNEGILIDAGAKISELEKIVDFSKIDMKYIILTHGHIDHIYYLDSISKYFNNIDVFIHKDDIEIINDKFLNCSMMLGIDFSIDTKLRVVDDNYKFEFGKYTIDSINVPGHTPGGICLKIEDFIFTGDTLFSGSVGRGDLGKGNMEILVKSIKKKLLSLDENTVVYPGHGDFTTIKSEKAYNLILQGD